MLDFVKKNIGLRQILQICLNIDKEWFMLNLDQTLDSIVKG